MDTDAGIRDKFNFITAFSEDSESVKQDHADFLKINKARNVSYHAGESAIRPNEEIARLLSKYLKLHFTTQ